jgi:PBSX family phage terminase large subunit
MVYSDLIFPRPFHICFIPNTYLYKLWYGGRGGGKSETLARALLTIAAQNPRTRVLCTREIQDSIKDSVHKTLSDIIYEYTLPGFKVQQDVISHRNGSDFIFKGAKHNINAIKSTKGIKYCWVEEAQSISEETLEILIPTIREANAEIWFSFNRMTRKDAVFERFCVRPDPETHTQKINWYDNPFFPDILNRQRLECLRNRPERYRHIWDGEPDTKYEGSVVKRFTPKHIQEVYYQPDLPLYIACDFNKNPMMWALAHISLDNRGNLDKPFFFDEIVVDNTDVRESADIFLERYPNHKGSIILMGDASGAYTDHKTKWSNYAILENALRDHGYKDVTRKLRASNPRIDNRIDAFNEKIYTTEDEPQLYVAPRCKYILYNIEELRYKPGTTKIDLPGSDKIRREPETKYLGHIFDAVSYLIEFFWPVTKDL